MIRYCKACNSNKPEDHFRVKRIMPSGKPSYGKCRSCEAIYDRERRAKKGLKPQYFKEHKEVIKPTPGIAARMRVYALRPKEQMPIHNNVCKECNSHFKGYVNSVYCSRPCAKAYSIRSVRTKRKALERGATVETVHPYIVFERCNWICTYCGIHTPRNLRGKHKDNSPELDHIIALSKGGEHSYLNTTLACRKCNNNKKDNDVTIFKQSFAT